MSQPAKESLSDAQEEAWEAAVETLVELANDDEDVDWERVSKAGTQILSAGRKGKACAWKLDGDES